MSESSFANTNKDEFITNLANLYRNFFANLVETRRERILKIRELGEENLLIPLLEEPSSYKDLFRTQYKIEVIKSDIYFIKTGVRLVQDEWKIDKSERISSLEMAISVTKHALTHHWGDYSLERIVSNLDENILCLEKGIQDKINNLNKLYSSFAFFDYSFRAPKLVQ